MKISFRNKKNLCLTYKQNLEYYEVVIKENPAKIGIAIDSTDFTQSQNSRLENP